MRQVGVSLVMVMVACGDHSSSMPRDGAVIDTRSIDTSSPDTSSPDALVCPAPIAGALGGPCSTDAQCDSSAGSGDGFCLRDNIGGTQWPASGYCINKIDTCTNDASCGTGGACITINDPAASYRACLPSCGTGACACALDQVCASSLVGAPFAANGQACTPGSATAKDGDACADFSDCAEGSLCLSDPFERPGGQCARIGCTVGTDTTCASGGDGHCVSPASQATGLVTSAGSICVDACISDADCRQSQGYRCFNAGGAFGKYCRHPQAGDACAVDLDCGDPTAWDCLTTGFPGGMCTPTVGCTMAGSAQGCSGGSSVCFDPVVGSNACADRCVSGIGTQSTCRTGYLCTDVDPSPSNTIGGCLPP